MLPQNIRNVPPCVGEIGDTPLESEFFDIDPQRGVQVTLMAHEVVFIPFAFLSLEPRRPAPLTSTCPRKTRPSGRGGLAGDGSRGDNAAGEGGAAMAERSVAVAFVSASHGHVVSVVQVSSCFARSRVLVSRTWGTFFRVDDMLSGWLFIVLFREEGQVTPVARRTYVHKTDILYNLRHRCIDVIQSSQADLLYYLLYGVVDV